MNTKSLIIATAIWLALGNYVFASPVTTPDFQIEPPDSWIHTDNPDLYPFAITHSSNEAELLIFRSDLEPEQTISTAEELKLSVQKVIDSVILSLPNSKLISNTGFNETDRTGFALEFISADPDNGAILRHRMMGWLYRHTDGHQILFTLWGKGLVQNYPQYESDILQMQSEFAFAGPHTAVALISSTKDWALPVVVILMAIAGLLYFRSSKNTRHSRIVSQDNGWICGCGLRNSSAIHQCRKCGLTRTVARVR